MQVQRISCQESSSDQRKENLGSCRCLWSPRLRRDNALMSSQLTAKAALTVLLILLFCSADVPHPQPSPFKSVCF